MIPENKQIMNGETKRQCIHTQTHKEISATLADRHTQREFSTLTHCWNLENSPERIRSTLTQRNVRKKFSLTGFQLKNSLNREKWIANEIKMSHLSGIVASAYALKHKSNKATKTYIETIFEESERDKNGLIINKAAWHRTYSHSKCDFLN